MNNKREVRESDPRDAWCLATRLRQTDKDELEAAGGLTPLAALTLGYEDSKVCYTGYYDGRPEVMFGVGKHPQAPNYGVIWLLASDVVYDNPMRFVKESLRYTKQFQKYFTVLFNYVDERNTKSQRWLEAIGFEPTSRHPEFGAAKIPFILYTRS